MWVCVCVAVCVFRDIERHTVYRVNIAAVKLMRTLRTHGVRIY